MYYEFVKVMLLKNKISQNGIVWNGFYYFMYLGLCPLWFCPGLYRWSWASCASALSSYSNLLEKLCVH